MNTVSSKTEVIYVKFDDQNAGQVRIRTSGDRYAVASGAVLVTSVLGRFKLKQIDNHLLKFKKPNFP